LNDVKTLGHIGAFLIVAALLGAGPKTDAYAQEVVAVLSSELRPYLEAYEGFEEKMGRPVPSVNLNAGRPEIGRNTRVVVAFGSKAVIEDYPEHVALVYCMAPGAEIETSDRQMPIVAVHMLPEPQIVVARLKFIQPALKRLAVLWILGAMDGYVEQLRQAAAKIGVELLVEHLDSAADLPNRLRALAGAGVDALWVPPDPLLINAQNFAVLKDFSWANDAPLYVPTAGLVESGGVASVGTSFRQIGQTAAAVTLRVLQGQNVAAAVYPKRAETTLNTAAAARTGLNISAQILQEMDRVLP
jgi:hypothetical protein